VALNASFLTIANDNEIICIPVLAFFFFLNHSD